MSVQVVRMARVEGAGGGLGKHIDGETRPESAAPRVLVDGDGKKEVLKPVVLLDEEGEQIDQEAAKERIGAAQGYMQKCRRKKTRGRQAMGATTWVFAGPPRYDGEKEPPWSTEKVRAWSKDCVKWAIDRVGPGSRLAHCALHQDEGAPHLHATLIVADEQGRLGWNRVRKNFTVPGKTGVLLMSGLQDNFHEAVGRKHGLERGEVGSDREHAPVDRALGLKIRVEEERNRGHQAKVQAGQTIAAVLERADDEAAERYRSRLDAALREVAAADGRAALATKDRNATRRERDTALEQRDRAREDAKQLGDTLLFVGKEQDKLKRDNLLLGRTNRQLRRAVAQAVEKRDEDWRPHLQEQVAAARQESADELARVRQGAEDLSRKECEARRERDQAIKQIRTLTAERDRVTTERDEAKEEVRTVTEDGDRKSRWADRLVRVMQELGPGRRELERAVDRVDVHPEDKKWLAKEVGRGRGIDR